MLFLQPVFLALSLICTPVTSGIDAPVSMHITGAVPGSPVTLELSSERYGLVFRSRAVFKADPNGRVDAASSSPVEGSYQKADPMGLFWTMTPSGPSAHPALDGNELRPRDYVLVATNGAARSEVVLHRLVMAPGVEEHPVSAPGVIGEIFHMSKRGCEPGVLVLGGSDGGTRDDEAAAIASHGFTALTAAYVGRPPLSPTLSNVPVETVTRAIAALKADPHVCSSPVSIVGESKGAELALIAASLFPGIGKVVALSPASAVFGGIGPGAGSSWAHQGVPLPAVNGSVPAPVVQALKQQQKAHQKIAYRAEYEARLNGNTDPRALIPVELIKGPVLLIAGGDDLLWPSADMARRIMQRLKQHRHPYRDVLLLYPKAGHQIGLPYQFTAAELAHSTVATGGSAFANETADVQSWPQLIEFLKK